MTVWHCTSIILCHFLFNTPSNLPSQSWYFWKIPNLATAFAAQKYRKFTPVRYHMQLNTSFLAIDYGQTDRQTDRRTFAILELLLRLKIYQKIIVLDGGPDFHPHYLAVRIKTYVRIHSFNFPISSFLQLLC